MQLQKLEIELERWGENKGKYKGVATFAGDIGSVVLNLTAVHCERIFLTCAEAIVDVASETANMLKTAVIDQKEGVKELE